MGSPAVLGEELGLGLVRRRCSLRLGRGTFSVVCISLDCAGGRAGGDVPLLGLRGCEGPSLVLFSVLVDW